MLAEYDDDSGDDDDDEERGEWLFQLQDVRGMSQLMLIAHCWSFFRQFIRHPWQIGQYLQVLYIISDWSSEY